LTASWVMNTGYCDGSCVLVGLVVGWFFSECLYEFSVYVAVRGVGRVLLLFGAVVGVFLPAYLGVHCDLAGDSVRDPVLPDYHPGRSRIDRARSVGCASLDRPVASYLKII
jgi:hypothetical protein